MNRPPSPHPNKLPTILENVEPPAPQHANGLEQILYELNTIKIDITEIKKKLSK